MKLSIVIRCGRNWQGLKRCLKSIDEQVEVVISAASDAKFLNKAKKLGVALTTHRFGNWSLAAENGLEAANNNDVIIMDADSVFTPGAILEISQALKSGHLLVQPRVNFLAGKNIFSRLISNARTHENQFTPKAYSPGLGLKKKELMKLIGVDGKIYNSKVLYGDDGYLDQKTKSKGIKIFLADKAIIDHDPIGLTHELITIFNFGRGQRQLEADNPRGLLTQVIEEYFSAGAGVYYSAAFKRFGLITVIYMVISRLFYLAGYVTEVVKSQ